MTRPEINDGKYVSGLSFEEISEHWNELKKWSPELYKNRLHSAELPEDDQYHLESGIFRFLHEKYPSPPFDSFYQMKIYEDMHLYWDRHIHKSES